MSANFSPRREHPGPEINADTVTISFQTEAVNQLLAAKDCPSELRPLIDYLIGASEGSIDWFEKSDAEVGLCARSTDELMSLEAAKKWVQRHRTLLVKWQNKVNIAFIECSPGGKDTKNNEIYKSRYKLNILKHASATVEQAQAMSGLWQREPLRAIALAAGEEAEDADQTTKALKSRFRAPRQDDEALLRRNPATALTLLKQACAIHERRGGDPVEYLEDFFARAKAEVLGNPEQPQPRPPRGKYTPAEARRIMNEKRATADSSSVHTSGEESVDKRDTAGEEERAPSCVPPFSRGMDKSVHPPPLDKSEEEAIPDELRALDAMESAGADVFKVVFLHDPSPQEAKWRRDETLDSLGFRKHLGDYLALNKQKSWSMVVRPSGESELWQVDDASPETVELLREVSFLQIETSPGNFQCWLALSDELDREEFKAARERFLRFIDRTGGNGGSFGALRWPGSTNFKPERRGADGNFPVVRVVHALIGQVTTTEELEGLGLLAPPITSRESTSNFKARQKIPHAWPDWSRELARAPKRSDGLPDRSVADFNWCLLSFLRGWSRAEIAPKLSEVSAKARDETKHYIEVTVDKAEQAACA
jgi:hypothetical protein